MIRSIFLVCCLSFVLLPLNVFSADRIELDETAIQGSRELPKILYVIPWKSTRLGLLQGGAGSNSFDTAFEALDRDVFRRQVEYYDMLYGAGAQTSSSGSAKVNN
ncbi:hypothetical protein MNBD_GAMMA19-1470 [hydrothermal vent metagenome]|uniref:Uncharacterized protein n=1 Tax=hydrothermal vent metagenome TaxID=652676 RepID=A0A3B1AQW2_9ZZZZ